MFVLVEYLGFSDFLMFIEMLKKSRPGQIADERK